MNIGMRKRKIIDEFEVMDFGNCEYMVKRNKTNNTNTKKNIDINVNNTQYQNQYQNQNQNKLLEHILSKLNNIEKIIKRQHKFLHNMIGYGYKYDENENDENENENENENGDEENDEDDDEEKKENDMDIYSSPLLKPMNDLKINKVKNNKSNFFDYAVI